MEKEKLFCYGNSKNAGELIGKCGYFGDSEEEIQQLIDSGAKVRECNRVDIGNGYSAFYPKHDKETMVLSFSYFYCVDSLAAQPTPIPTPTPTPTQKLIACPGPEAHSEDMQAYAQQQLKIILQQSDNPSLQFIYNYAKSIQTKNEDAKQLFNDLQSWYNSKLIQLHDFLIKEISNEECITSDVLRSYADKLDEVDNFELLTEENFDSLQDLLNEYNI